MNVPNRLSMARIALSPVFFIVFFSGEWFGFQNRSVIVAVLWVLFAAIEITDLLDGYIARKRNLETDLGKILDPFADSLSRLTYFSCFTIAGIMPAWVFALVLYRDLGVAFVRQLASKRGIVMSSRFTGKLKAWLYAAGGVAGLVYHSFLPGSLPEAVAIAVSVLFYICAVIAVWSLIDYTKSLKTAHG